MGSDAEQAGTLELLDTGYWCFRLNHNQFAQWPKDEECLDANCFGWDQSRTARRANAAVDALLAEREKRNTTKEDRR